MLYAMKQKLFCLGDDYRILDQDGRDVYLSRRQGFCYPPQAPCLPRHGRQRARRDPPTAPDMGAFV